MCKLNTINISLFFLLLRENVFYLLKSYTYKVHLNEFIHVCFCCIISTIMLHLIFNSGDENDSSNRGVG